MKNDDLIHLRENETAVLIRNSNRDRILKLVYGQGGVAVKWRESLWVLPILATLRGVEIPTTRNAAMLEHKSEHHLPLFTSSTGHTANIKLTLTDTKLTAEVKWDEDISLITSAEMDEADHYVAEFIEANNLGTITAAASLVEQDPDKRAALLTNFLNSDNQ